MNQTSRVALAVAAFGPRASPPPPTGRSGAADRPATRSAPRRGSPLDFRFPVDRRQGQGRPAGPGVAWTAGLGRPDRRPARRGRRAGLGLHQRPRHRTTTGPGQGLGRRGADVPPRGRRQAPLAAPHPAAPGKGVTGSRIPRAALGSAPLVEGDRLWYVNNRSEVVCFDIGPLQEGDRRAAARSGSSTCGRSSASSRTCRSCSSGSPPPSPGTRTGCTSSPTTGWTRTHANVPAPDAPSLVCLEKATGKVVWTDNSPGKNILEHQISSPLVVEVGGRPQVIVGQGDGWLRASTPATGKLLWKCDLNPKDAVWELGGTGDRNYVVATPSCTTAGSTSRPGSRPRRLPRNAVRC